MMAHTGPARIAILGAESTGKSTLAETLARHYGTVWVPEYLREFVATLGRVPFEHDQPAIARTQRARQEAMAGSMEAGALLFCDTTPLMTAVYSRVYWGRAPAELLEMEAAHDYALTFVAAPDLPWVPDGLQRESEAVRMRVHETLLAVLRERGIGYTLVTGEVAQRVGQVEAVIDRELRRSRAGGRLRLPPS